jgi:hypothetical protein
LDTIAKLHGLGGKVKRGALANTKDKLTLTKAEMMALGGYCKNDVDYTYTIFDRLLAYIPDDELELIDLTVRMFCDPVLEVDIPLPQDRSLPEGILLSAPQLLDDGFRGAIGFDEIEYEVGGLEATSQHFINAFFDLDDVHFTAFRSKTSSLLTSTIC